MLWLVTVLGLLYPAWSSEGLELAEERAFRQAVALVDPCVVRIETTGGLDQVDRLLVPTGPTTGVIVDPAGWIMTSSFNFAGRPTAILVTLADGRRFNAKLISSDEQRMLSLLKIDATDLSAVQPAERSSFRVGQWAIAVGRTYDSQAPNLSVGIVSALNRVWGKAIQTDAKISPSNYGGPLVDLSGRTLGIIVPLSPDANSLTAGVEWYDSGIGFAVPLADVLEQLPRMQQGGDLKAGLMGVAFSAQAGMFATPQVTRVRAKSPAAEAGMKRDDIITAVDGRPVERMAQFRIAFGPRYAGESVELTFRRGETSQTATLKLVDQLQPYDAASLGVIVGPASAPSESADGSAGTRCLLVRAVLPGSAADRGGIQVGDRLLALENRPLADLAAARQALAASAPRQQVAVQLLRQMERLVVPVTLDSLAEFVVPSDWPPALPLEPISTATTASGPGTSVEASPRGDGAVPQKDEKPADTATVPAVPAKRGRFNATPTGYDRNYWAYIPDDLPANVPAGLVVWLHNPGDTAEAAVLKAWKLTCDRMGLVLVGPRTENPTGWQSSDLPYVLDVIADIRKQVLIDPDRLVVHALAGAGSMATLVTARHRPLIRGLVLVGFPFVPAIGENEPDEPLQVLLWSEAGDAAEQRQLRESRDAGRKAHVPVTLRDYKKGAAEYPIAAEVESLAHWIQALSRL